MCFNKDTSAKWMFCGTKQNDTHKPKLTYLVLPLRASWPIIPPPQHPRLLRTLCLPLALAAWLQLTCGMARSKHLTELLLSKQKANSLNHSLLMPLTPGFHTHIHTYARTHARRHMRENAQHAHTFCLKRKHMTKLQFSMKFSNCCTNKTDLQVIPGKFNEHIKH